MFMNQPFISDYYRALQKEVQSKILGEKDETILHSNSEELTEYYFSNNSFDIIEFDPDNSPTFEHRKDMRVVPANQREELYRYEGDLNYEYESIAVSMPILPNKNIKEILELQSSTFTLSGGPNVIMKGNTLFFSFDIKGYGFQYDDDRVASEVNGKVEAVKSWIDRKNDDINKENIQFKQSIKQFIEQRKNKLSSDKDRISSLVSKINIPLKQKDNEAATRIKLDTKPLVKKVKPNPQLPEEYVLDHAKVLDIISVINNQGRQFEKTPKTYKDFGEEGLRDVILVSLNSLFEGKATGETFSNKGKTDIYLNIDKGNILICECKIWGGQSLYSKTIDQLLGYLTWRQNFGVMITFVKQKNLSKILDEIEGIVSSHPSYINGFKKITDTHFVSNHKIISDDLKSVEIHHLFYNLYTE